LQVPCQHRGGPIRRIPETGMAPATTGRQILPGAICRLAAIPAH